MGEAGGVGAVIGMTVCSGIGAPEVSAPWIDWRYQSEIEKFPCAVLAHRFPDAVNLGDMTKFKEWPNATVDILCGGTPCQSFSVAGLRKGLDDPRGNLALTYLAIAERYRPRWVVWENVPGVFSSTTDDIPDPCPPEIDLESGDGPEDGEEIVVEDEHHGYETHALGAFLAGLSKLGYGFAYRVLDAQYVRTQRHPRAVPQRRRRVFVVGYLGGWRPAAAVLFDAESLRRDTPPRREAGQGVAPTISARPSGGGGLGTDFDCDGGLILSHDPAVTLTARDYKGPLPEADLSTVVAHTLRGEGFDASEDGTGRGTPLVPVHVAPTLRAGGNQTGGHRPPGTDVDTCETLAPVAFSYKDSGADATENLSPTLRSLGAYDANGGSQMAVAIQERAVSENPAAGPQGKGWQEGVAYTLEARSTTQAVAFAENQRGGLRESDVSLQLTTGGGKAGQGFPAVRDGYAVRRLTPVECERLQGFPDNWTRIPWRGKPADKCPDGPRYKALGNSWAVNCGEFIFERIKAVEAMT